MGHFGIIRKECCTSKGGIPGDTCPTVDVNFKGGVLLHSTGTPPTPIEDSLASVTGPLENRCEIDEWVAPVSTKKSYRVPSTVKVTTGKFSHREESSAK
ncbi:hypothetical protein FKM82_025404 [Ascaphus truei]